MTSSENDRLVLSYNSIRNWIGFLGIFLPVQLSVAYFIHIEEWLVLDSISHYYHASVSDLFIGTLGAITVFFIAYKGHDRSDRITSICAAVGATGLAIFPELPMPGVENYSHYIPVMFPTETSSWLHYGFAALFFVSLIVFTLIQFPKSDPTEKKTARKEIRNKIYHVSGIAMILLLLCIPLSAFVLGKETRSYYNVVFFTEAFFLWVFGITWFLKGGLFLKDKPG